MENVSRKLLATPEGLLRLFLEANVSVELLAGAFEIGTGVIESSLKEAMRRRDAINRAGAPSATELAGTIGDLA
jgi:hypothetical protein